MGKKHHSGSNVGHGYSDTENEGKKCSTYAWVSEAGLAAAENFLEEMGLGWTVNAGKIWTDCKEERWVEVLKGNLWKDVHYRVEGGVYYCLWGLVKS